LRFDDGSLLFILDSQIMPEIEQFVASAGPLTRPDVKHYRPRLLPAGTAHRVCNIASDCQNLVWTIRPVQWPNFLINEASVSLYPMTSTVAYVLQADTNYRPTSLCAIGSTNPPCRGMWKPAARRSAAWNSHAGPRVSGQSQYHYQAYSELEHEGLLELRQGAGAFICLNRRARSVTDHVENARKRAAELVDELRDAGLRDDEIRRVFEAELLRVTETVKKR
jgi:hypothetical protein